MTAHDNLSEQFSPFVDQVSKSGGASMSLSSGRLLQPGKPGYMVGGEADQAGKPLSSWNVPEQEFGPEHVSKFASALQESGPHRDTHIGAWKNDGEVVLDASRKVKRSKQATRMGKQRNQISVWDNRRMREIDTGGTGN